MEMEHGYWPVQEVEWLDTHVTAVLGAVLGRSCVNECASFE